MKQDVITYIHQQMSITRQSILDATEKLSLEKFVKNPYLLGGLFYTPNAALAFILRS